MQRGLTRRAALGLPLIGLAYPALAAATWPQQPIRWIVPAAPGGGADITARILGATLGETLGRPVLVENRSGASGIIATDLVAKSPPDGYTLLLTTSAHTFNPALYSKLPYDTIKDFTPITLILRGPNVLVVHPSFPAHTVAELIALVKSKPGHFNYASTGSGTAQTMAAELFKQRTGTDIVGIAYRGGGPALIDVAAGRVPMMFGYIQSAISYVRDGRLRAIAVTGETRTPQLPDLPTVAESGVPGYSVYEWNGLSGPAGLPAAVVQRLHDEIVRALKVPAVKDRLTTLGAELIGDTPQEFGTFIATEIDKWGKVIKRAGLHAD